MAISPSQAEARAVELSRLYAETETRLIQRLADSLREPSQWQQLKLGDLRRLQQQVDVELKAANDNGRRTLTNLVDESYSTGVESAVSDLSVVIKSPIVLTNEATIAAFVDEAMRGIESSRFPILRQVDDVYRRAVIEGSRGAITGVETRRQAVQSVLNQFADRGVTGFTDRAGRRWGLPEYSDMAARTAMGRAAVRGHMNTLTDNGHDLVIVSDSPEECERCRPYEGRVYSLSGQDGEYPPIDEAMSGGLFHPRCVTGDTLVSGPPEIAASSRWYEGQVVVILTTGGYELTITPNHPVLTRGGWVAAGLLNKGDEVTRHIPSQRMVDTVDPDDVDVPARIENVARSFDQSPSVTTTSVPLSSEDFHGDASDGDVAVIRSYGLLRGDVEPSVYQPFGNHGFSRAVMATAPFFRQGDIEALSNRNCAAASGSVGIGSQGTPLIGRHPCDPAVGSFDTTNASATLGNPITDSRLANTDVVSDVILPPAFTVQANDGVDIFGLRLLCGSQGNSFTDGAGDIGISQTFIDERSTDIEGGRQLLDRLSSEITFDAIVKVETRDFSGHVYNLSTIDQWYACNSIITHNCTHRLGAYFEGITKPMHDTANPVGYEQRQRQRRMERNVRRWKRREAAAISDDEKRAATAKIRQWQGELRRFTAENDRKRRYDREQVAL